MMLLLFGVVVQLVDSTMLRTVVLLTVLNLSRCGGGWLLWT